MPNEAPPPSVAVIGAGLAGLTLATRLKQNGLDAVVFDKGRGVAGRMATRRADNGQTFDHGAQYFTARDPRFNEAVAGWRAEGVVAEWNASIGTLSGNGFRPDERNKQRYVGVPGNNALCLHLAKPLGAPPLDVRSGVTVGEAKKFGSHWRVRGSDGKALGDFDWLVSSAPAPQSATLLADAPEFAAQASATTMTGCWAVMVAFDEPLDLPYQGAFVEGSPLSWIACDSSKPGRPEIRGQERWVLHGSPEWSQSNIELTPGEATLLLKSAFWRATGVEPRVPVYERAHRWRYALPPEPLAEPCLFDADLRVGACGDWCGGPRVEGAFLSGAALADQIVEAID